MKSYFKRSWHWLIAGAVVGLVTSIMDYAPDTWQFWLIDLSSVATWVLMEIRGIQKGKKMERDMQNRCFKPSPNEAKTVQI